MSTANHFPLTIIRLHLIIVFPNLFWSGPEFNLHEEKP